MNKNKIHLDGADLTEKEKQFIHEVTPFLNSKLPAIVLSRFSSFLKQNDFYSANNAQLSLMNFIRQAQEKANLLELSPKVVRAIELLSINQSPRPLTNTLADWKWSNYYDHYVHRGCHRLIRYEIDGPIYFNDAIHHFPKPQFKYWQGYSTARLVRADEFPINPLTNAHPQYYYAEPWDGRGKIEDRIASSTLLEFPEHAEAWLAIKRTQFESNESQD